tara:strand:+ start:252 stop:743 length:492 start_codon:yes stop_codon:yes gene_type:complete
LTQKDQLLSFFSINDNWQYTLKDIYKQFPKFSQSGIRRTMQELIVENKVTRESPGHYNINEEVRGEIYRKILKVGASCDGKQVLLFAVTFEGNDIDREDELLQELLFDFKECTLIIDDETDLVRNLDNWGKKKVYKERGYAEETWDKSFPTDQIFPKIRTGTE